ncbi:GMC family oxidoreductase [Halioxenophilus aromaticivorans]|uniref:GMC family oxidoreductase n=1 Tax=Halioxenophilus aromaticivorans TaxID=1306992 RepID=A0AAV3U9B1_9ALTE
MSTPVYDAIVVGSGISGGWAAKEFTEKGMKTLLVERGPEYKHQQDYKYDFTNPWELPARGKVAEDTLANEYAIQQRCYAMNEMTRERFVKDNEHEYIQEKPFDWIRGYHTGGRSIMWGRQSYRWSDLDFEANKIDGHGVDWPIRYADLESWYDYVEEFAGISGNIDNIPHVPDGKFQPPMELNCVEREVKKRLESKYDNRHLIIGRCAHLTKPTKVHMELGRGACMSRNQCQRGCSFGAYFSSQSATLPAARRTGNLEMTHNAIVKEVIYDEATGRAKGVKIVDRTTLQEREYHAKVVFLCASTIGTTQIMLNSRSRRFPNGIGNDSGALGRYLMDHTMHVGATGTMEGFDEHYYKGRRPNGIYIPRFRNLKQQDANYVRGFGYQGGASRPSWQAGMDQPGIGTDLKASLKNPGTWQFRLIGFGEMLPYAHNRITLDEQNTDQWGIPLLRMDCEWGDNEHKMREDIVDSAVEMLKAVGAKDIVSTHNDHAPGLAIHEMGTARMGKDPKTSVLNKHNQCHSVPNLFVTDGAAMASSACQNPSLTYMALTARAVDFAVKEIETGRL